MCVLYNPYNSRLSVKMAVPNARWIREQEKDIAPANFKAMLEDENEMEYDGTYYDDMDFNEQYETFDEDEEDDDFDDDDDEDEEYDEYRRRLNIDDFYDLEEEDEDQG